MRRLRKLYSCLLCQCSRPKQNKICFIILVIFNILVCYWLCTFPWNKPDCGRLKHGLINVLPGHHLSLDHSNDYNSLLQEVSPSVHYLWCKETIFNYKNYLSIVSAYKFLQPTEIILHYWNVPQSDFSGYYDDLVRDIPNFFAQPLTDSSACSKQSETRGQVFKKLLVHGGIYIDINVILSKNIQSCIKHIQKLDININVSHEVVIKSNLNSDIQVIHCAKNTTTFSETIPCVIVPEDLTPVNIFEDKSEFAQLARMIHYGEKDILEVKESPNTIIPNVIHYLWLINVDFSFLAYLSILSSLFVQNAEYIYIHCENKPSGIYWNKIIQYPKVKVIVKQFSKTVYDTELNNPVYYQNVLKVDILNRYGGIYLDWDVIWVVKLPESRLRYAAVTGISNPCLKGIPTDQVLIAKKGALFLQFLTESFRHVIGSAYNSDILAYKIYEQHPSSLYIDQRLITVCDADLCTSNCELIQSKDVLQRKQGTNLISMASFPDVTVENIHDFTSPFTMVEDIAKFVLKKARLNF